jgi:cellulose synthase/poly-beta-1,6-N-acetylglucosamine synthase-like glycosyltransferase
MLELIIGILNNFFFVYMFIYAVIFFFITICAALSLDDFSVRKSHMSYIMLENKSNYVPISILVPAYNEELTISDSVDSLLNLDYPVYEIVVINDGSKDNTAKYVIDKYNLKQVARPYKRSVPCKDLLSVFESETTPRIILVNKENGGKADALNMGINICSFPMFICMDADSVLKSDALSKIAESFLENDETIAAGGNIQISNNLVLKNGKVMSVGPLKKPTVIFQMLEYFRVFFASRVTLNQFNANLIISGAFGLYSKKAAVNVGGYTQSMIGEDMELIVKMHAFYRKNKLPYNITYVPDAICYTQAPEDLKTLKNQRRRWHMGMIQSLKNHMFMCLNPKYGAVGMVAFPYFICFELIAPFLDILGLLSIVISYFFGLLNTQFFLIYLIVYMGYSMIITWVSVLLDKFLFGSDLSAANVVKLLFFSILESVGFRQLMSLFRLSALFGKKRKQWGEMIRVKNNQSAA